jgi:hypothetical protein
MLFQFAYHERMDQNKKRPCYEEITRPNELEGRL